jgi:uncharacterized membrane protein
MKSHKLSFRYLQFLLVIVLVLGVFFRFVNLERKVYWIDEVHTSLRTSGYKKTEFVEEAPVARILKIEDLQKFQRLSPEKDWSDTFNALAANAEHTPLYYVMARLGMQWFGSSVTVTRGLAALISLLVFPCIYWLCLELFKSPLVGWMAMALIAVSPIHVLYAQEAREYTLWTVAILLSSVLLLRAIRLNTKVSWGMYAVTVALGLYSHMLSGLVFVGHGIYVFAIKGFRLSKTFTAYLLASLAGFITLVPWIVLYFINASTVGEWTSQKLSFFTLCKRWLINLSSIFFDIQIGYDDQFFDVEEGNDVVQFGYGDLLIYVIPLSIILILYSIYFLCKKSRKPAWLLILILMGVSTITLVLPDVISGGQRSTIGRYLIPCYLGIQIAVAYLLATQITSISVKHWQQKFWQLIAIALFSAGILSCAVSSQAETWWNKYSSYYNPQVAQIINETTQPLVISSQKRVSRITSLSYELDPKVRLLLVDGTKLPNIIDGFSDVFLFRPSGELQSKLEKDRNYKLQIVHRLGYLWRLQK